MSVSFTNMPPNAIANILAEGVGRDMVSRIRAELQKQVDPILNEVARKLANDIMVSCEAQYNYVNSKVELSLSFKDKPVERMTDE